ncbi:MAG: DUF11 domain-containing protein [Gammaproteobacteria bacterium]|nr:MAG: DUF11 domain-containing protein [Gammaproteobacteria bacterium]
MRSTRISLFGALLCLFWFCAPSAFAQNADLGVIKTGPSTASSGSNVPITYSLSVANNGPDDASTVALTDPLPSGMTFTSIAQNSGPAFSCATPSVGTNGTITCTLASLPNGSTATFTLVAAITTANPGDFYQNTATIASAIPDPNNENDSSPAGTQIPVPSADLYVIKSGPGSVGPNTDITYTILVGNAGPDAATSASWSDTLPGTLTFVSLVQSTGPAFTCSTGGTISCSIASLPSGTSAQFTLVAHVPAATPSGTSYTNTATISSAIADPNPENNSSDTTATVSSADVAVTKTAPATVTAGQNMNYILTLSNNGPDAATNAQFLDNLPAGVSFVSLVQNTGPAASCTTFSGSASCTIGILSSGASAQFTLTVKVASSVANGTVISNAATASTSSFDSNPSNDSASASTTVQSTSDLSIVKTGPATVVAGSNVSYTLTIANAGPDLAGSPSLSDTLPPGTSFVSLTQTSGPTFTCTTGATVTCTRASGLAAGASATLTLTAAVSGALANGSTVSNTAAVSSSGAPDSNPANNTSTSNATVGAAADLAVTKTASYSGALGSNIVYTLGITNNGPSVASAVQLSDTLPAGTHFVSLTQSSGPVFTCTTPAVGAGGTVNCSIAVLAAGANAVFVLTVDTIGAPAGTTLVNTANATSTTSDPNVANNAASAAVTLANLPLVPAPALSWLGLLLLAALLAAAGSQQRRDCDD